jgi:hypothetical protein
LRVYPIIMTLPECPIIDQAYRPVMHCCRLNAACGGNKLRWSIGNENLIFVAHGIE